MAQAPDTLSLRELADETGVSERTIRYYIQFGLLPSPQGAGPNSHYGRGHLGRLRLIRSLQDKHLPLSAIREILARRAEKEFERLAEGPAAKSSSSALDYVQSLLKTGNATHRMALADLAPLRGLAPEERSHWERIRVAADIELHVRRPLSKRDNRRLEELIRKIRELFPEGEPR